MSRENSHFTDKSYSEEAMERTNEILDTDPSTFKDVAGDALTDYEDDHYEEVRKLLEKIDSAQYRIDDCHQRHKHFAANEHRRHLDELHRQLGDLISHKALNWIRDYVEGNEL